MDPGVQVKVNMSRCTLYGYDIDKNYARFLTSSYRRRRKSQLRCKKSQSRQSLEFTSRCLLKEYVTDNYNARLHPRSYHGCREKPLRHKKITKSVDREIYIKVTRSRCVLDGYVKDNYYARFQPRSYQRRMEKQKIDIKIHKVSGT